MTDDKTQKLYKNSTKHTSQSAALNTRRGWILNRWGYYGHKIQAWLWKKCMTHNNILTKMEVHSNACQERLFITCLNAYFTCISISIRSFLIFEFTFLSYNSWDLQFIQIQGNSLFLEFKLKNASTRWYDIVKCLFLLI